MVKRFLSLFMFLGTLWLEAADCSKYTVPDDLKVILDAHQAEITNNPNRIAEYSWLPGYLIKRNASSFYSERMEGYIRAQQAITEHPQELSLIRLPQKFHYRPKQDKYSYVIVKKIAGVSLGAYTSKIPLSLEQAKQLASFIKYTGWTDSQRNNFATDNDGNIYIIDTKRIFGTNPSGNLSQLHHYIRLTDGSDDIFTKYIENLIATQMTYSDVPRFWTDAC